MAAPINDKDNNSNATKTNLPIYPAFCFKASPTNFNWVKLSLSNVHKLTKPKGFEAQNIFFYNNHPIRFVTVLGLVIARTETPRRTILTLDDSSGATVDVVVLKADDEQQPSTATTTTTATVDQPEQKPRELHLSATTREPQVITSLVPGTLTKMKATLSTFRSVTQLQLERFFPVPDLRAELRFLEDRNRWWVRVLSVPWVLAPEEVERLRVEADEDGRRVEEKRRKSERRARKRVEREGRDQRRILEMYESDERKREREARRCREAGLRVMSNIEVKKCKLNG